MDPVVALESRGQGLVDKALVVAEVKVGFPPSSVTKTSPCS